MSCVQKASPSPAPPPHLRAAPRNDRGEEPFAAHLETGRANRPADARPPIRDAHEREHHHAAKDAAKDKADAPDEAADAPKPQAADAAATALLTTQLPMPAAAETPAPQTIMTGGAGHDVTSGAPGAAGAALAALKSGGKASPNAAPVAPADPSSPPQATQPPATAAAAPPGLIAAADAIGVSTSAAAGQSSAGPARTAVAPDAVPITIAAQVAAGDKTFTIRLDPAELGEVQVHLKIGEDGQTRAHLIVERPATLHQLMQDAPRLEQALAQAAGGGGSDVSFSLKQEGRNGQTAHHLYPQRTEHHDAAPAPLPLTPAYRPRLSAAAQLDMTV